jgi:hypothetical protein
MSCLLPLILGFCAFDPSQLEVSAHASSQIAGSFDYHAQQKNFAGSIVGRIAIEVTAPVTRGFSIRYGVEHMSLLETHHDRGEERAFVGFVWRPFVR